MRHKHTYTYKVVGGHEILADVYSCSNKNTHPAILWFHGGALISGTRRQISAVQLNHYLAAGYTVISADYRLAPETKLQSIIEDIEDAYTWLRVIGPELFNIDPDRVVLAGVSAGGYLTLMAGIRLDPRPKALVSFYGYGNITGSWYTQPDAFYNKRPAISKSNAFSAIGDSEISSTKPGPSQQMRILFYLYCRQQGVWPREVSGHNPEFESDWFNGYEPLNHVTEYYPPTMLLHGKKDTDVPFEQSQLMHKALKQHQVSCEMISDADWGHGFDNSFGGGELEDDHKIEQAMARVVRFIDHCLSVS
jgi:acetyl esterase/lipase